MSFARSLKTLARDACGIPLRPTWSLRELLSSHPSPSLSSATFERLHALSALVPPDEDTREYNATRKELDELVRLVEAVRLVDTDHATDDIPDGRVWAENTGIPLAKEPVEEEVHGTRLLDYSNRTQDGLYVVETDRAR